VVTATEAKEWAREHLRGNCSSLTAFPDELKGPVRAAYRASGFLRADG
jgi:hypothetical protein